MGYDLLHTDIMAWAASYDGPPFHALLCDAPYEIEFMGREWDGTGIAYQPDTWRALARHLHPGAFLFVFAGTVNDDLISVAMRQAGLRKHHKMLSWSYGSGLQKSTRMDDKIDRRAGAQREVIATRKHAPKFAAAEFGYREKDNGYNSRSRETFEETAPATDMAQTWAGHRYGLQHLKPAIEPILVFQKPYDGDALTSITRTGAGAINIEGGRIEAGDGGPTRWETPRGLGYSGRAGDYGPCDASQDARGRWPANLALSHHPACLPGACVADCVIARLGAQSGVSTSPESVRQGDRRSGAVPMGSNCDRIVAAPGDTGTAARYFFNSDWLYERLEQADQIGYFAKCSPAERDAGLDPLQAALIGALDGFEELTTDDGRKTPIDNPFLRGKTTRRNTHTTVKPLALTRWLATLLLPPPEYGPRRLLVPFGGVASEVCGAILAGWEEVVGVELVEEHVRIGRARLAYWQQRAGEFAAGQDITVKAAPAAPAGQMSIFDMEEAA